MPERSELERKLARELGRLEQATLGHLLEYLGFPPNAANVPLSFWADYTTELNRILTMHLQNTLLGQLVDFDSPLTPNWDDVIADSTRWSRDYITRLAQSIADNSRSITDDMVRDAIESGLDADQLAERLSYRFGPVHAEMIAVTEITRAHDQSSIILRERLNEMGVTSRRRWLTSEDERVCPLCGPMDHTLEDDDGYFRAGGMEFKGPPDPHPRCRCETVVERVE